MKAHVPTAASTPPVRPSGVRGRARRVVAHARLAVVEEWQRHFGRHGSCEDVAERPERPKLVQQHRDPDGRLCGSAEQQPAHHHQLERG
eukprot:841730-Pleurochrysis_carterae.AAC.1